MIPSRFARFLLAPALVIGVAGFGLTSCSKANSELACSAADDVADGVADVASEVRERDLRDAQGDVRELRRDFDRLSSRTSKLGDAERTAIEPLLAPADEAIAALETATTLEDMSAALDSGRAPIDALAKGVETTLRC